MLIDIGVINIEWLNNDLSNMPDDGVQVVDSERIVMSFQTLPKIFIFGSPGSGKKTLLNGITGESFPEIISDKMHCFVCDLEYQKVLICVFEISLISNLTHFDHIFWNLVEKSADVLLVIFNYLNIQDLQLLDLIKTFYSKSLFIKRVFLIHNVKYITSQEVLSKYIKELKYQISSTELNDKQYINSIFLPKSTPMKEINQIIVGDQRVCEKSFKYCCRYLNNVLNSIQSNRVSLLKTLRQIVISKNIKKFIMTEAELNNLIIMTNKNMLLSKKLDSIHRFTDYNLKYVWFRDVMNQKIKLILEVAGLDKKSLICDNLDEERLLIKFDHKIYTNDGLRVMSESVAIPILEPIIRNHEHLFEVISSAITDELGFHILSFKTYINF